MSVTLRDVFLAVSYGDASLVGESAGYLILGAADAALGDREQASLDSIAIDEEGSVRLRGPKVDEDDAERALRQLLALLLKKVRIPSNNLQRVASRSEPRGLQGLVAELEAALVPVNRRAARRTLARLCREAKKSAARQHAFARVEEIEPQVVEPVSVAVEPSPEPAQVQMAPSPAPVEVTTVSRAEQTVDPQARRVSQLPTVPAQPQRHLLDAVAGSYGSQTPVEATPPVVIREPRNEFDSALGFDEPVELGADDFDVDVEDAWDEAPTQVFAGVAPAHDPLPNARAAAPAAAVPVIVPPAPRRRRHSVIPRRSRQIADEDSLIVMSESAPRRAKSDISELLDRMSVSPMSTDSLYQGLKTLSRIELSPLAPPVGAERGDDADR